MKPSITNTHIDDEEEKPVKTVKRLKYDRYRKKSCPRCQAVHYKKGKFCSLSCGNVKTFTKEYRENMSKARQAYFRTPEGIAFAQRLNKKDTVVNDEFAVGIPEIPEVPEWLDDLSYNKAEDW